MEKKDIRIFDLLPVGKENAISTADLLKKSGCRTFRDLQQCIASERAQGAVICSGTGRGYWKPKNRKEIEDFCRTMDARVRHIFVATKSARALLRQMDRQQDDNTKNR